VLPVGVQENQSINVEFGGTQEEGFQGSPVASIDPMPNDGRPAGLGDSSAGIGRTIIDANDFIDVPKSPYDNRPNGLFLVVHRHACNDVRLGRMWHVVLLRHGFPFAWFYIWMFKKTKKTKALAVPTTLVV
jgi:hypothetical protein